MTLQKRDRLQKIKAILQKGLIKILAGAFLFATIGNLLQLGVAMVLARQLGVEGFGIFVFAYGIATLIARVGPLGWHTLAIRYIPQYLHEQDSSALRGLLHSGNLVGIGVPVLILLVVTALCLTIVPTSQLGWALIGGCVLGPVAAMQTYQRRKLSAIERPVSGLFYDRIVPQGGTFMIILIVPTDDYKTALAAYFFFGALAWFLSERHFRRDLPLDISAAPITMKWREWLRYSLPATLGFSVRIFINKTDVLMLPTLSSLLQVGLYGAAFRLTYILTFPQTVISTVMAPKLSAAYAARDSGLLRLRFVIAFGFALATTLPAATLLLVLAEAIMTLIFGQDYVHGARALQILTLAQLTAGLTVPTTSLLLMAGSEHKFWMISLVGLIGNGILNLALIPFWGAVGAATATLVSSVIIFVMQGCYAWPILFKKLPEKDPS